MLGADRLVFNKSTFKTLYHIKMKTTLTKPGKLFVNG